MKRLALCGGHLATTEVDCPNWESVEADPREGCPEKSGWASRGLAEAEEATGSL